MLIFDKIAQHFVLHRVDSTFDMNLISAPWQSDAEELRSQYPQLDPQPKANPTPATASALQPPQKKVTKPAKAAAAPRSVPAARSAAPKRTKVEKPKKKVKEPTPEPEVDDDSDDGLTIEYPGGKPPDRFFNSTPVFQRAASESEEDEEVPPRIEDRNQDVDMLHLPSPAANGGERSEEEMELDLEAELEAELEAAFEEEADGQDSDESEEE